METPMEVEKGITTHADIEEELEALLAQRDEQLADRDAELAEREEELAGREKELAAALALVGKSIRTERRVRLSAWRTSFMVAFVPSLKRLEQNVARKILTNHSNDL